MIGRFSTGALRHSSSFGVEFTHESQYAPTSSAWVPERQPTCSIPIPTTP